jgi:hypothetical protein
MLKLESSPNSITILVTSIGTSWYAELFSQVCLQCPGQNAIWYRRPPFHVGFVMGKIVASTSVSFVINSV